MLLDNNVKIAELKCFSLTPTPNADATKNRIISHLISLSPTHVHHPCPMLMHMHRQLGDAALRKVGHILSPRHLPPLAQSIKIPMPFANCHHRHHLVHRIRRKFPKSRTGPNLTQHVFLATDTEDRFLYMLCRQRRHQE